MYYSLQNFALTFNDVILMSLIVSVIVNSLNCALTHDEMTIFKKVTKLKLKSCQVMNNLYLFSLIIFCCVDI